jgi:hypothetical protein
MIDHTSLLQTFYHDSANILLLGTSRLKGQHPVPRPLGSYNLMFNVKSWEFSINVLIKTMS